MIGQIINSVILGSEFINRGGLIGSGMKKIINNGDGFDLKKEFNSEWEKELKETVDSLISTGWKVYIEPYYVQGEETLTLQKNDRYLHLAYGDLEELKAVLEDVDDP